jgi:pimeloyl-ACP methyl ester carboxylesterase
MRPLLSTAPGRLAPSRSWARFVAVLDAAGIGRAHVLGASLGGMVAQELAITRPERVGRLVLACTTPGWALGYPMPAASLRLIMATRGLPLEAARRRHTEHALSAQAMHQNPALVGRLMEVQGHVDWRHQRRRNRGGQGASGGAEPASGVVSRYLTS